MTAPVRTGDAHGQEVAPIRLIALGESDAVVCEGDACAIPDA